MSYTNQISSLLNDPTIDKVATIQSLWGGYGEVARFHSKQTNQYYVVKMISLDRVQSHPRGWNSDVGHQRKLKSFIVEANFYRDYGPITDKSCYTPKLLAEYQSSEVIILIMEDLFHSGFDTRLETANDQSFDMALQWLASFHSQFMYCEADNLWPTGTYWHLATRKDEFDVMPASIYKDSAEAITQRLQMAQHQTLVHGDAKFQNLCFDVNRNSVAAVDFQYVGKGVGVKDLAYLCASSLSNEQLYEKGDSIIEDYLVRLEEAMNRRQVNGNFHQLKAEYTQLMPLAWADYYRFLLGWNSSSAKISDYMIEQANRAIKSL